MAPVSQLVFLDDFEVSSMIYKSDTLITSSRDEVSNIIIDTLTVPALYFYPPRD